MEVNEANIKYKKWDNQGGPTYTLQISNITSITYENGSRDNFVTTSTSSKEDVLAASIDKAGEKMSKSIDTTGDKVSYSVGNVAKQQDLYRRARALEVTGYTLFGLSLAGGVIWGLSVEEGKEWIPCVIAGVVGTGIMASCLIPAADLKAEAEALTVASLMEYKVNDFVSVDLCGFNYKPNNQSFYGVGVNFKF